MTEAAAPAVPEVPQTPPPSSSATPPVDTPAPERTFSQKELDEIVEKRLAKERRKREELRQERDVLRKLALERGGEPAPKKEAPSADREPVRADFETYEDFIHAQTVYRARGTAREEIKKAQEEQEKKQREESARKASETFRTRLKENAKDIEDFEDTIASATSDPNSAVSRLPADPISECDNPAKVLHYYATHPEDAERIANLPMGQQAREIWKLDTQLAQAAKSAPARPSAAPAPISPVGGGKTAPSGEMPDPVTQQKEWLAWRNAQVRLKRTGKSA